MENLSEEKQLKLLNYIAETIELTKSFENTADLGKLKHITSSLRALASELDEYTKNVKRQEIKNALQELNTNLLEYQKEKNATGEEIFCKLIIQNLPDNINSSLKNSNEIELKCIHHKNVNLIGTIKITGTEQIHVEVYFIEKPEVNRKFDLPNYKCIYSVINYINLALGYSETLK